MRSIFSSAVAFAACGLLAGCATHAAYGPDSDTRLEQATTEKASAEGAEASQIKCADIQPKLRSADEKPEGERMKVLTEAFKEVKDRATRLEDAIARNPDLVFTETGDAVKSNLEECRAALADATSTLDRSVRDIAELPVIQEVQGNRTVPVPRMEFEIVREAIETLGPGDKDVLLAKIESAEKKVAAAKKK
ncbi:MAG: hypothetical protein ACK4N5_05375 [Myxococcales bacterium]